jgi:hypothetical protein
MAWLPWSVSSLTSGAKATSSYQLRSKITTPQASCDINQADHYRNFDEWPITAAKTAPLPVPNVATATTIARSKLFEAAVNDKAAHWE